MQLEKMEATATLTTYCTCEYYDDNEELVQAESCLGYCGDESLDWAAEVAQMFLTANDLTESDHLLIEGTGMGWTRASGYKLLKANPKELSHALMLSGDFTIEFYLSEDNKTLTARRWSHDEPMGTGLFTFQKVEVCQYSGCESMEELKEYKGEKYCPFCFQIAELNW